MSTRAMIHVTDQWGTVKLYHHYDGYPEGLGSWIFRFFRYCRDANDIHEFDLSNYPQFWTGEMIAARLLVWLAAHNHDGIGTTSPLAFDCPGVASEDHGDAEYTYTINCSKADEFGYPVVSVSSKQFDLDGIRLDRIRRYVYTNDDPRDPWSGIMGACVGVQPRAEGDSDDPTGT